MFSQDELDTVASLMLGGHGYKPAKQQLHGKAKRRRRKLDYSERRAEMLAGCRKHLKVSG